MSRVLPILFNTEMVRAILDGRKTVTRRVIKNLDIEENNGMITLYEKNEDDAFCISPIKDAQKEMLTYCQYQPGDILYVRETVWQQSVKTLDVMTGETDFFDINSFRYCATDTEPIIDEYSHWRKRPSIHMPKEAARIWLRVTDVRVERLQDITEEQAEKEGLYKGWKIPTFPKSTPAMTARQAFMWIWDPTIKKSDRDRYGWITNPWVWVIEFERCEKPGGEA